MCPGIYVEVGRQIQQLVLLFYLVSERLSLFSFRLDPELPVLFHLQLHLPRAGLGSQLFTLYFQLLRGLLGFELSVLTCKAIWSTAPSLEPSLSYLQALILQISAYVTLSLELCLLLARNPRSFACFWNPQPSYQWKSHWWLLAEAKT